MPQAPIESRPKPPVKAEVSRSRDPAKPAGGIAFAAPPATSDALSAWQSDGVAAAQGEFGSGLPAPRILVAMNDPKMLPPEAGEPAEPQGIADLLLGRARDGARLARVFEHDDFGDFRSAGGEAWARAVTEHLTGIPIADPARFYAEGRPAIARAMLVEGRVPLAALSEDAVTAALCAGGWDGGAEGSIGCGAAGLARCKGLGDVLAYADHPELSGPFDGWDGALWERVGAGACLFWAGAAEGSGRVAVVLRKRVADSGRTLQLFGTLGTEEAPVLSEGELLLAIPASIPTEVETFRFAGIGILGGLGAVRTDLRPRGRCRLLLRRRSDGKLLYRSAWISMAAEGISIARLLASLRNSPRAADVEATWRVHSLCLTPTDDIPDSAFLVECTAGKYGRVELRLDPAKSGPGAVEPGAFADGGGKAGF
jgi:hypothetical protein